MRVSGRGVSLGVQPEEDASSWRAYYRAATAAADDVQRARLFRSLAGAWIATCRGGHPAGSVEVPATSLALSSLVCTCKASVHELCTWVASHSRRQQEEQSPPVERVWAGGAQGEEEREEEEGIPVPDYSVVCLLAVLARSPRNRVVLLRWNLHQPLVRLVRALGTYTRQLLSVTRTGLTRDGEDGGDVGGGAGTWWRQARILEEWLPEALQLVASFADPDFTWVRHYAPTAAVGERTTAPRMGAASGETAATGIMKDVLPLLVSLLQDLHGLSLLAPFSRERYEQQEQLLLTVGAVLRHVLTRAVDVPQQTVTDAVDALFDLLGWPAELGFLDPSSRPAHDEQTLYMYRLQLLVLRVLCEALAHPDAGAEALTFRGRCKIADSMLWAATYFGDPPQKVCFVPFQEPESSPLSRPVPFVWFADLACNSAQTLISMLKFICVATCRLPDSVQPAAVRLYFESMSDELEHSAAAAEARQYFRCQQPIVQLSAMHGLIDACREQPCFIGALRDSSSSVLHLAFGGDYYDSGDKHHTEPLFRSLQLSVFTLLCATETAPWPEHAPTNISECKLLLTIAKDRAWKSHGLVSDVAQNLSWLLDCDALKSRESFARLDALSLLQNIVTTQQKVALRELSSDADVMLWTARRDVFKLCAIYLEDAEAAYLALCQEGMGFVAAMFDLLYEAECRDTAMHVITTCMSLRARSDEAFHAKVVLLSKFTRFISSIIDDKIEKPLELVSCMLKGLVSVVQVEQTVHQNLLRDEAMCFLHIVTFWNTWDYGRTDPAIVDVTVTLVQTLTCLIRGNDTSKEFFAQTIGYDRLQELLLRPGAVSDRLVQSVHEMMFDGQDVSSWKKIQNADCVPMYIKLILTREPEFAAEKLQQLLQVLTLSSTNLQSCCETGVLDLLIGLLPATDDSPLQLQILKLIETLGCHSITAKQLRAFLGLLVGHRCHSEGTTPTEFSLPKLEPEPEREPGPVPVPEIETGVETVPAHERGCAPLPVPVPEPELESEPGPEPGPEPVPMTQPYVAEATSLAVASRLLDTLLHMWLTPMRQPLAWLDMDGKDSGLHVCETINRWPTRSYSFCAWLKIQLFPSADEVAHPVEPRLFSFLTKDGRGIESFFRGRILVLRVLRVKHTQEAVMLDSTGIPYEFESGKWYHIAIVHRNARALGQSEVSFFVNGIHMSCDSKELKYPDAIEGTECYIGTNAVQAIRSVGDVSAMVLRMPLCCQLASLYFFDDGVSIREIEGMYSLGPNYMFAFQPTEDPVMISDAGELTREQLVLLDGKLSSRMWLSYNARACDGNTCFNTTPEENGHVDGCNARLLKRASTMGTRSCVTRKLKDTMSAIGGVKLLFPLFTRLQTLCADGSYSTKEAQDFAIYTIQLFQRALTNRNHLKIMTRHNGFAVMHYLLRQLPPGCFCARTCECITDLSNSVHDNETKSTAYRCLLFQFGLWAHCVAPVQSQAIQKMQDLYAEDPDMFQQLCGVQGLLDVIRNYFTDDQGIGSTESSEPANFFPPCVTATESKQLLRQLFQNVFSCLCRWHGEADLEIVLRFLVQSRDVTHIQCSLEVLRFLSASKSSLRAALSTHENTSCILTFLNYEPEKVRCEAILLIATLLVPTAPASTHRSIVYAIGTAVRNFVVSEPVLQALFSGSFAFEPAPITLPLHCLPTSTEPCRSNPISFSMGVASFPSAQMIPEVVNPVFLVLLIDATRHMLTESVDSLERLRITLQTIDTVLGANMKSIERVCSVAGWQQVLLHVLTMDGCTAEIESCILNLFRTLHAYAFRHRLQGWQVLAESLAHAQASTINQRAALRCKMCLELLQKIGSASTAVSHLDNMMHLMMHIEDVVFAVPSATSDLADGAPAELQLSLAHVAVDVLTSLIAPGNNDVMTVTLPGRPGGLARIVVRLLVRLATDRDAGDNRIPAERIHQYLKALQPNTDATYEIVNYALAKLLHAGQMTQLDSHSAMVARAVQHFVHAFDDTLGHSLPDARLCQATLADDDYQKGQQSDADYRRYIQRAYLSHNWVQLLQTCSLVQVETNSMPANSTSGTAPISHFPGYNKTSDEDQKMEVVLTDAGANEWNRLDVLEQNRKQEKRNTERSYMYSAGRSWKQLKRSLAHERSPWDSDKWESEEQFWKLDPQEGAYRQRMLLRRNYSGSRHEGASKHAHMKSKAPPPIAKAPAVKLPAPRARGIEQEDWEGDAENDEDGAETVGDTASTDAKSDDQFLEDKHVLSCPAELVKPMRLVVGSFDISTAYLQFSPDPQQKTYATESKLHMERRWPLQDIVEVHPRRYLLQHSAIEVFLKDRTNHFVTFKDVETCREIIRKLIGLRSKTMIIVTRKTRARMLRETTAKWKARQMSNFEYIMQINTLSGRTYNDLSQYPVFPWVIQDYSSETLDLTDERIYRDLSKPVGALNPSRLQYLVERAQAFEDPEMGIPKFLYGSHYSTGGTTLFYMLRMEPFTTLAIELQGGTFDHADRMFHSISSAWTGVLNGNQDFKELTPEFFYTPEFLYNRNGLDLGTTQRGDVLGDVIMPPWASNAHEFVRINRLALESVTVSQNLHHWMDLIFGYKQQGPAAEEAHNVFYYLTYEGRVDINAIDDPRMRKATEEQIIEYGQTPLQLFAKKHSRQNDAIVSDPVSIDLTEYFYADPRQHSIIFVHPFQSSIVTLSAGRRLGCHRWIPYPNFQGSTFTFELDRNASSRTKIGVDFTRDVDITQQCFAVTQDGQFLFSCGHWDATFKCSHIESGRVLQTVAQHKDTVTSLSLGDDGTTLITGSLDATVIVWDIVWPAGSSSPELSGTPRATLYGHRDEITCTAVHTGLGIVASTSKTGCIVHKTQGGFIRALSASPDTDSFDKVLISSQGTILLYSSSDLMLFLFSVNGQLLASADAMERLHAWALTSDNKCVVTGSDRMIVKVRALHNLKTLHTFGQLEAPIYSLTLCAEENVVMVGLEDGRIAMLTMPCDTVDD